MNVRDSAEGALYGTLFFGALGQVPPFTVLPDEIIGLPAGAIIGALVGARRIKRAIRL